MNDSEIKSQLPTTGPGLGVFTMFELIPLRCLKSGQTGEVSQVLGDPQQVHRLQELGLRQGITVEVLQSGSPCIIRTSGSRICLRPNEGLHVLVRPNIRG